MSLKPATSRNGASEVPRFSLMGFLIGGRWSTATILNRPPASAMRRIPHSFPGDNSIIELLQEASTSARLGIPERPPNRVHLSAEAAEANRTASRSAMRSAGRAQGAMPNVAGRQRIDGVDTESGLVDDCAVVQEVHAALPDRDEASCSRSPPAPRARRPDRRSRSFPRDPAR